MQITVLDKDMQYQEKLVAHSKHSEQDTDKQKLTKKTKINNQ